MQVGYGISNAAMFQNLQNTQYWYGTEGGSGAWYLSTYYGIQGSEVKSYPGYAMAVHSGDVGTVVANVPEPETYAMLLAGLGLIGAIGRRRSRT